MFLLALFVITSGLVLVYGIQLLRKYRRIIELTANWPSPPSVPLLGHAHHFIGLKPEQLPYMINNLWTQYGEQHRMKIWFCGELNLFLGGRHDLNVIFTTAHFNEKSDHYNVIADWLGEGLLTSSGSKWQKRRKLLTPAFHFSILKEFVKVFERQAKYLIRNLGEYANNQKPCELYELLALCTLDVICESSMGVSMNAQTDANSPYVKAVNVMKCVTKARLGGLLHHFDFTYQFTQLAREEKKAIAVLHSVTERIIEEKRAKLLANMEKEEKTPTAPPKSAIDICLATKMAFLDLLLHSTIDDKPLSNADIREEVDTFIFEGYETTATALQFCFYNLAKHPAYQQKCFEEVMAVLGNNPDSSDTSHEQLNDLHFIELCIKESLRMYPPVLSFARKTRYDCQLNELFIPAGTNISIVPLYIFRQEDNFSNPNTFWPERFVTEQFDAFTFIPFSAGPRNCIGQKFAMLELKSVVANVLRHFELRYLGDPNVEPKLSAALTLQTSEPLMFQLKRRVPQ